MDSDLVASVVALGLGAAVVVVGLRRDLSEATRDGLPRFGGGPGGETPTLGLYEAREGGQLRQLSRRQQLLLVAVFVSLALSQGSSAVLSSDDRPIHAAVAVLALLVALGHLTRKPSALFGELAGDR